MNHPRCLTCRHYDDDRGECRHSPPVLIPRPNEDGGPYWDSGWPEVSADDWCGQHELGRQERDARNTFLEGETRYEPGDDA